jgi:hypothetical protein
MATPCYNCHLKEPSANDTAWRFREIGKKCVDCHNNIHQTFISERHYPGQICEICHNEERWAMVSFDHGKTSFELEGAHQTVTCRSCHFKRLPDGTVQQQFTGLSKRCDDCHTDTHLNQFDKEGRTDCSRCHIPVKFKPASKFDHAKTLFPLEGKHKEISCSKCHKVVQEKGSQYVLYKIKDFRCENCHL